ncbi:GNAT family N-acetyltransferase [Paenibacillus sp. CAU 1782]
MRVTETWQRAAVYYVRINTMVKGMNIPLELEFDQHDGEQANYMLLLDGSEPVAAARLNIIDEKTAKIERVCVAAEYQGKGCGRMLIEATERWAKEFGAEKIIITSQDGAVGFYEKLGYRPDWDIKYEPSFITIVYTDKLI